MPCRGARIREATWSADIRDLLNVVLALDRPVALVGHSKGGGQVTAAPWLLDDRVRKVVNIDGFGPPPFPPEAMQSLAQRCADYLDVRRRSFERSDWRPYQSLEQLSRYGRTVPHLLVGALVNAHAVGETASRLVDATGLAATILACGECWQEPSEAECSATEPTAVTTPERAPAAG